MPLDMSPRDSCFPELTCIEYGCFYICINTCYIQQSECDTSCQSFLNPLSLHCVDRVLNQDPLSPEISLGSHQCLPRLLDPLMPGISSSSKQLWIARSCWWMAQCPEPDASSFMRIHLFIRKQCLAVSGIHSSYSCFVWSFMQWISNLSITWKPESEFISGNPQSPLGSHLKLQ